MNSNLVSMEVVIEATILVSLEAEAKKGGVSAGQHLSNFLPDWIASIPAKGKRIGNRATKQRVA